MGGTTRGWILAAVAIGASFVAGPSCRVAESDVKRWETTQHGPCKLVAVITHDKYGWDLRTEAALSLVRMPPRGGVRQGIKFLIEKYEDCEDPTVQREGALSQLSEQGRQQIVDRMAPDLVKALEPPPPSRTPEGRLPADPTVPFKDAAFAMLIHEPPLVTNDKTKADIKQALTKWSQTGFEDRVENGSQQYGLEQMMHYLGSESVKTLPSTINENTARLDRIAGLVNDVGDDATKLATSQALVTLAQKYHSKDWLDGQRKIVEESNKKNNINADANQVNGQIDKIQERRLTEEVFPAMKKVGGRPSIEYLYQYAANGQMPAERRKLALAALEGRVDKNNPQDLERLFAIARNDDSPDAVRDVAFQRMQEFPREQIVPKLYTMFEPKKWKVRWVAAETILKTMQGTRQVREFLDRLPKTSATKGGMTEGISYAKYIRELAPQGGEAKPRDIIQPYLSGNSRNEFGAKMTALSYFWEGNKADRGAVAPYQEDRTELPKCDKEDDCSWTCDVPKAGNPKEMEPKELKTVGDFVKFCLIPSMEH
jgi:hypothetical protein